MIISDDQRRNANMGLADKTRKAQAFGHRLVMNADLLNFQDDLKKIERCGHPWLCRRSACKHCGGGVPHTTSKGAPTIKAWAPPQHPLDQNRKSTPDSNIRRKGEWMAAPFAVLPTDQVSVLRIMIKLMDADENPVPVVRKFRRKLMAVLKEHFPSGILRGYAEIAGNHANARYSSLPEDVVGSKIWASGFTNMPGYNLHMQAAIFHPGYDRFIANAILAWAFPGKDSVWLDEPDPVRVDEHGNEWGGVQGWGEYTGFELKKLNFLAPKADLAPGETYDPYAPHENDNFAVSHVRLMMLKKLPRSMRNFKYRDDEKSIMEAITNAWVIGAGTVPLTFACHTLVTTHPKTSTATQLSLFDLGENGMPSIIPIDLPHVAGSQADGKRQARSQVRVYILLKRSRVVAENFSMKSMAAIAQIRGFCDRPGIDKPPWCSTLHGPRLSVRLGLKRV
jgi:hypothetical protein